MLLPLFFVVVFPLAFVSALHDPAPHDVRLMVVGPAAVVEPIAKSLDDSDAFAVSETDVVSEAAASVEERRADGSILVQRAPAANGDNAAPPSFSVTAYTATAGGRGVAGAVEGAARGVAQQMGASFVVEDVAPLGAEDPLGTNLFNLLVYSSLGGFLAITVLTQVNPAAKLRYRWLTAGISAVASPLIVFGLSSIFVGDYGAGFGTIAGLLAIDALYVFTVAALMILVEQFLGLSAAFGIMAVVVFLNFPSAGAGGAAMLPGFWQGVHDVYFGAGAFESFRSLVYFDGHQIGRWLAQVIAWTLSLVALTSLVELFKVNRRQRREIAILQHPHRRHAQPEHRYDDPPPAGIRADVALTTNGASR